MTFDQSISTKAWFCCLRLYQKGKAAIALDKRNYHTTSSDFTLKPLFFCLKPCSPLFAEHGEFHTIGAMAHTKRTGERNKEEKRCRKRKMKSRRWKERERKWKGSRFQERFLVACGVLYTNTCLRLIECLEYSFTLSTEYWHRFDKFAAHSVHVQFCAANSYILSIFFNHLMFNRDWRKILLIQMHSKLLKYACCIRRTRVAIPFRALPVFFTSHVIGYERYFQHVAHDSLLQPSESLHSWWKRERKGKENEKQKEKEKRDEHNKMVEAQGMGVETENTIAQAQKLVAEVQIGVQKSRNHRHGSCSTAASNPAVET